MSCKEFIEKISLYIDGYINEKECEEIENHMEKCKRCKNIYEDLMTIKIFSPSLKDKYPVTYYKGREKRKILKGAFAFILLILVLLTFFFESKIDLSKESFSSEKKEKIITREKKGEEPVKIYYTDMIYEISYEEIMP